MRILLMVCAIALAAALPLGSAQRPSQITITCAPAQSLTIGIGADGTLTPIENWMSLCIVSTGGKEIARFAYEPTKNFPESQEQAKGVGQDEVQRIIDEMRADRMAEGND